MGKEHLSAYQCIHNSFGPLDDTGLAARQIVDPLQRTRLDGVEIENDQVGIHARRDAPLLFEPKKTRRLGRQSSHRFL
jgi:hypothetical protein